MFQTCFSMACLLSAKHSQFNRSSLCRSQIEGRRSLLLSSAQTTSMWDILGSIAHLQASEIQVLKNNLVFSRFSISWHLQTRHTRNGSIGVPLDFAAPSLQLLARPDTRRWHGTAVGQKALPPFSFSHHCHDITWIDWPVYHTPSKWILCAPFSGSLALQKTALLVVAILGLKHPKSRNYASMPTCHTPKSSLSYENFRAPQYHQRRSRRLRPLPRHCIAGRPGRNKSFGWVFWPSLKWCPRFSHVYTCLGISVMFISLISRLSLHIGISNPRLDQRNISAHVCPPWNGRNAGLFSLLFSHCGFLPEAVLNENTPGTPTFAAQSVVFGFCMSWRLIKQHWEGLACCSSSFKQADLLDLAKNNLGDLEAFHKPWWDTNIASVHETSMTLWRGLRSTLCWAIALIIMSTPSDSKFLPDESWHGRSKRELLAFLFRFFSETTFIQQISELLAVTRWVFVCWPHWTWSWLRWWDGHV